MTPRSRHAIDSFTHQLHTWNPFQTTNPSSKKPCRSDRSTAPTIPSSETLDLSILSLDPWPPNRWFPRKRRRRGSRSVSGRSSDRSGTHNRQGRSSYATCSDFPLAAGGTDSSGELWGSDASEVRALSRREMKEVVEKECFGGGGGNGGGGVEVVVAQGNESGYGSEPGYRGDGEFGYGDEFDEEEEDRRHLFWGDGFGGEGGE